MMAEPTSNDDDSGALAEPPVRLALAEERVTMAKRRVVRRRLRISRVGRRREEIVRETLTRSGVEIERVPIGTFVDSMPAIRTEDGVTILPVVEERIVMERRLFLVEEVRVREVVEKREWNEAVTLRYQDIVVEERPLNEPPESGGVASPARLEEGHHG